MRPVRYQIWWNKKTVLDFRELTGFFNEKMIIINKDANLSISQWYFEQRGLTTALFLFLSLSLWEIFLTFRWEVKSLASRRFLSGLIGLNYLFVPCQAKETLLSCGDTQWEPSLNRQSQRGSIFSKTPFSKGGWVPQFEEIRRQWTLGVESFSSNVED